MERTYAAIDLKSFYASVECRDRNLDPLITNLVVADQRRTDRTICLAVSPALKSFGVPGRPRLFEVIQKVQEVNSSRQWYARGHEFHGASTQLPELQSDPGLKLDYIIAPPRMARYMEYSTRIYAIYLKYLSSNDIHVYSIDEILADITDYIKLYKMNARELVETMIHDIYEQTGITATAGIGSNLYLCKIAMDIVAKKAKPDTHGVRIAELDEQSYREQLWNHRPLTDFWRVGKGYQKKLESHGIFTMGDIARCSIGKSTDYYNEDLLYNMFGVNAELLIDHAWGWEPCTLNDIKMYKPETTSMSSGQVLHEPYPYEKVRLVVQEMTDSLVLDLVQKKMATDQIILTIGYDRCNVNYTGPRSTDAYGRTVPKHAHGTVRLESHTSTASILTKKTMELFQRIMDKYLLARKITICFGHLKEDKAPEFVQMSLFDFTSSKQQIEKTKDTQKEHQLQEAILELKTKFGKNAVLKGTSLMEGATAMERNEQIGGHKA